MVEAVNEIFGIHLPVCREGRPGPPPRRAAWPGRQVTGAEPVAYPARMRARAFVPFLLAVADGCSLGSYSATLEVSVGSRPARQVTLESDDDATPFLPYLIKLEPHTWALNNCDCAELLVFRNDAPIAEGRIHGLRRGETLMVDSLTVTLLGLASSPSSYLLPDSRR